MRWVRRGVVLALLASVMIAGWRFAAENQQAVSLHYVAGELPELALWQVMLAAFGAGAGLVGLFAMFASAKNSLATRRYRRALSRLEAEIHQLRNLPLAPEPEPNPPGGLAAAGPPRAGGALGQDG